MAFISEHKGLAAAAAVGLFVWFAISAATGRGEAWDHSAYWGLGFPVLMISCAILGWYFPEGAWRLGLTASIVQVIPLTIAGGSLGLLPFGIVVLAVIGLPLSLAAFLAARARVRRDLRSVRDELRHKSRR